MCKEEEKRDGVAPRGCGGIDVQGSTECFPVTPRGTGVGVTLARETVGGGFLKSAPISAELVAEVRGSMRQEVA